MVNYKALGNFAQFVAAGARSVGGVLAVTQKHKQQGPARGGLEMTLRAFRVLEAGANGVGSLATVRHGQLKARAPKTPQASQEALRDRYAELQSQGVRILGYVDSVPTGLPGYEVHPYGRGKNGNEFVEFISAPMEVMGETIQHGYMLEINPVTKRPVRIMEYVAYPEESAA